ncbi:MAG: hypothetical protein ACO1PB_15660 [Ramlibacter sp.]
MKLAGLLRSGPGLLARLLLAAWAIGIVVAGIQLDDWRRELTRTLVQLNADARFRAGLRPGDTVDPEWHRRKALSLLSATERIARDTTWTLFVPGSWRVFDDLEEQVQARIEREFGTTVVETIRRQLVLRAGDLTGVPLVRGTGDLQAGADCRSPIPQALDRKLASAAEDLPEFVAVAEHVAGVEKLDQAFRSFLALQHAGGSPDDLRRLVAYTLDTDLPGRLAHSVRLFHDPSEVKLQPALMQARLQAATRCSLGKAMSALHTRLLHANDLFALEQGLVERSTGLFDPAARPASFDHTLERLRAVHALLEDQHALLARGRTDWMRQADLQLGPAYQQVLDRIGRIQLLGPDTVRQLRDRSGTAFAEFRRQFEAAFGSGGAPGIVWLEGEGRFALSPERAALREGLAGLLKLPFMTELPPSARGRPPGTLAAASQNARALAAARRRFIAEGLPVFPAATRPVVARVVDTRVSELVYQQAYRALQAALPADAGGALDAAAFRQQREQVLALQAVLRETGGGSHGARLLAKLDGELLRRLAALHEEWRRQPLHAATDFQRWQGEPLAAWQALGATDAASVATAVARHGARLAQLGRQAKDLLAMGGPGLTADPVAARWLRLLQELERYEARNADSSLLRLEKYLVGLGPDLRRENCADRLAANFPAGGRDDDIGHRHVEIHNALANRCNLLRSQATAPAATPPTQ